MEGTGGEPRKGRTTRLLHPEGDSRRPGDPVIPPIVQSATFFGGMPGEELLYSRYGNNPNQLRVALKIAALEGMEAGLVLASGMGATAMTFLALAEAGDHVVASENLYGATKKLLGEELPRRGITTTFVDPERPEQWEESMEAATCLLFLETPTNPTVRIYDPRPVAELAHDRGVPLVMDTTFASSVNLRAGEHGADVTIQSATKYLGGHSDLIAGVVTASASIIERIQGMMKLYGPSIDPHAAWLLDRGLRTLDLRVARQNESGLELARWFEAQPGVGRTLYPGLASHPEHELACELLHGFGGVLSVVLEGGGAAADRFCRALEIAALAPSLGGVETLVSQPRFTSHRGLTPEQRSSQGIPDGFVRISVGIEDVADLKSDFGRALEKASG